jgi:hypothetical protein
MVELDLGRCSSEGLNADAESRPRQKEDKSDNAKERAARRNFNKHVIWCRLKMDPGQEIPRRMRETLERMVTKAREAMLENVEEDQEWDMHTMTNASSILKLLTDALTATAEELFPDGVPANNEMKGRHHWNS